MGSCTWPYDFTEDLAGSRILCKISSVHWNICAKIYMHVNEDADAAMVARTQAAPAVHMAKL